jgi:hypothetical protein
MTRRTGNEGLHARVVQDKRDAQTLRQVAAEIREARHRFTIEQRLSFICQCPQCQTIERERLTWADPDAWYAREVKRMRERAPA